MQITCKKFVHFCLNNLDFDHLIQLESISPLAKNLTNPLYCFSNTRHINCNDKDVETRLFVKDDPTEGSC